MTKPSINFLFLLFLVIGSANAVLSQSNERPQISPPDWILGSWNNLAVSDSRRFETITFKKNEINIYEGVGKTAKNLYLREKFKDYKAEQTSEPKLYRIKFFVNGKEIIYEFKLCETDTCKSFSRKALTYLISENKKVVREHSESINLVFFKQEKQN